MATTKYPVAQNPLLLRFYRLMDAFVKSDDEQDFYLDKIEGFILYGDLDKGQKELDELNVELKTESKRYCMLPKMTFYETKKFMEGFINEKVYDIDTKEKLLDIIQSKEARENFLEFIHDHLSELEKWQQYFTERMKIRIIEWLRSQNVQFVFEEDLELPKNVVEKLKRYLFDVKVSKDVIQGREILVAKSKTYYSHDAIHPRPKRGRPPKQQAKEEIKIELTGDLYVTVTAPCRMFLYLPDITNSNAVTFSARHDNEAQLLASLRGTPSVKVDSKLEALSQRLEAFRHLSSRMVGVEDLIGDKESRLLKTVSQQEAIAPTEENPGIGNLVNRFLPKRKEKAAPVDKSLPLVPQPTAKKVTHISNKKK
jgi:hypothetical protein